MAFITVGTGIGIGLYINKGPIHGLACPEGGHIRVPRYKGDDFEGVCPYHKDCIEGMCTNNAIAKRKGLDNVD